MSKQQLAPEQKAKVRDLRRIQNAPYAKRGDLIRLAALKYGVNTRTIYKWLNIFETEANRLPIGNERLTRNDTGKTRVSEKAVKLIVGFYLQNPKASAKQAQDWLTEHHPDVAYRETQSSKRRVLLSLPTIRKVRREAKEKL